MTRSSDRDEVNDTGAGDNAIFVAGGFDQIGAGSRLDRLIADYSASASRFFGNAVGFSQRVMTAASPASTARMCSSAASSTSRSAPPAATKISPAATARRGQRSVTGRSGNDVMDGGTGSDMFRVPLASCAIASAGLLHLVFT